MEKQKGAKKGIIAVGIIAVAVIAVLVGVVVYLVRSMQEIKEMQNVQQPQEEERVVIVKEDNIEDVIKEIEEKAEKQESIPASYEVMMSLEWVFEDGASVSENAYVKNSEANTTMVYFIVEADGVGEVYHSPYMEVGSSLDEIKLDKELEKGEYEAVITYYLVDDDFNDLSQTSLAMSIVVEN